MDTVWNGLARLARIAIMAGFMLLLLAAFIVTAEVLVRKAIPLVLEIYEGLAALVGINVTDAKEAARIFVRDRMTFSGSDEISGYLFAVGTSWSMAHVLVTRGHVRIDALYGSLSPRVRAILDIVALILLAIFVGALVERAYHVASTNLVEYNRSNTNLRIPFAWSQIPWLAGFVLFLATIVVAILRSLGALMRGDLAAVNAVAGAASMDEEIESEIKGLGLETHGGKK